MILWSLWWFELLLVQAANENFILVWLCYRAGHQTIHLIKLICLENVVSLWLCATQLAVLAIECTICVEERKPTLTWQIESFELSIGWLRLMTWRTIWQIGSLRVRCAIHPWLTLHLQSSHIRLKKRFLHLWLPVKTCSMHLVWFISSINA